MRIFIFASDSHEGLRAFAGDKSGSRLPERAGPWRYLFGATPGASLPHGIERRPIERAILSEGFQMWRMKNPAKDDG